VVVCFAMKATWRRIILTGRFIICRRSRSFGNFFLEGRNYEFEITESESIAPDGNRDRDPVLCGQVIARNSETMVQGVNAVDPVL